MLRRADARRAGQFEIIAENPVAAELELADAGSFLFFFKKILKFFFSMLYQIKEFIEGLIIARLEKPAFGDNRRRVVVQRTRQPLRAIGKIVPVIQDFAQGRGGGIARTPGSPTRLFRRASISRGDVRFSAMRVDKRSMS